MGGVRHQLDAVRFFQAQHIAGEFHDGKLHTEAQTQVGDLIFAGIADGAEHSVNTAAAEAAGHQHAGHALEDLCNVFRRHGFGVHPTNANVRAVRNACVLECFDDADIGVVQLGVFADQRDLDGFLRVHPAVAHIAPLVKIGRVVFQAEAFADDVGQMLVLHHQRHLIEDLRVQILQHMARLDIAEQRQLVAHVLRQGIIRAAHQYVRPQADALKLADAALRRLGFHFAGGLEVGDQRDEQDDGVLLAHLVLELADGFQEGGAFHIAHGAADLNDGDLVAVAAVEAALDLIGDVGNELHGAAAEIAAALALQNGAVDAAGGDVGYAAELLVNETLVVAEVEVGLRAVVGHEDLSVLDGVHGAGVDVEIRVELLHRHRIASGLEQAAQGRGGDALAETRHDASQYKYILHLRSPLCELRGNGGICSV